MKKEKSYWPQSWETKDWGRYCETCALFMCFHYECLSTVLSVGILKCVNAHYKKSKVKFKSHLNADKLWVMWPTATMDVHRLFFQHILRAPRWGAKSPHSNSQCHMSTCTCIMLAQCMHLYCACTLHTHDCTRVVLAHATCMWLRVFMCCTLRTCGILLVRCPTVLAALHCLTLFLCSYRVLSHSPIHFPHPLLVECHVPFWTTPYSLQVHDYRRPWVNCNWASNQFLRTCSGLP